MKVKVLTPNVGKWGTGVQLKKGRVYPAEVATKEKFAIRLNKGKTDILVNKVTIRTKPDEQNPRGVTLLLEKGQFEITEFKEREQLFNDYLKSKQHTPREHRDCKRGYELRPGFMVLDDTTFHKYPAIQLCRMIKSDGSICGKNSKFVKVIPRPGKSHVRIGCCEVHGTVKI